MEKAGYTVIDGKKVKDGSAWGNPAPLVYNMSKMGMWLFLGTEILLFMMLFVAYAISYYRNPESFHASAKELSVPFGTANTIILLFSSFTVAWSIEAIKQGKTRLMNILLILTIVCAGAFLVNKYFEYSHKMHEVKLERAAIMQPLGDKLKSEGKCAVTGVVSHGKTIQKEVCSVIPFDVRNVGEADITKPAFANMFFFLYFLMTGVHGLHIVIGMSLLIWILFKGMKKDFHPGWYTPVEVGGLYWHLVDLIWIYLFPLLYLVS